MPDGFRRLLTGTLLSVFFCSSPCIGEEKIQQFSSLIEIHTDGGLTITEKITVLAEGGRFAAAYIGISRLGTRTAQEKQKP